MEKTLYENEWISLKSKTFPNTKHEYIYSHETRCNGHIVVVLPFKIINNKVQYLLRHELNPAWGDERIYASVTGGIDTLYPEKDAIKELQEETGFQATVDELINLGQCQGTKSTDTIYHLFAVNLTDRRPIKPSGDGSVGEATNINVWVSDIGISKDPHVYVAFYRLLKTGKI